MAGESYMSGMMYETFIRRAFKCERGKNGAETAYMKNLIDAEKGSGWVSHLPAANKQFEKVKGYIGKALDKYSKLKPNAEESEAIESLKDRLAMARSAADLVRIVDMGLEATQRFK